MLQSREYFLWLNNFMASEACVQNFWVLLDCHIVILSLLELIRLDILNS